jgi:hypothetical protein
MPYVPDAEFVVTLNNRDFSAPTTMRATVHIHTGNIHEVISQ